MDLHTATQTNVNSLADESATVNCTETGDVSSCSKSTTTTD